MTYLQGKYLLRIVASVCFASFLAAAGAMTVFADGPPCTVNGTLVPDSQALANPNACDAGTGPNAGGNGATTAPDPVPTTDPQPEPAPEPAPEPEPAPVTETAPQPDPAVQGGAEPAPTEPVQPAESTSDMTEVFTEGGTDTATPAPTNGDALGGGSSCTEAQVAAGQCPQGDNAPGPDNSATDPDGNIATNGSPQGDSSSSGISDNQGGSDSADGNGDGGSGASGNGGGGGSTAGSGNGNGDAEAEEEDPVLEARKQKNNIALDIPEFQDARTFRESYTVTGRIPDMPKMSPERAKLLADAAESHDVSFGLLASMAWIESRWGDPASGGFIGTRLNADQWLQFGVDADKSGTVEETSEADAASTLAAYLASEPVGKERGALVSRYFGDDAASTRRSVFLAGFFNAMGAMAMEKGLDDEDVRRDLAKRVLDDERIEIYATGRGDIRADLIDPRVLVTIGFLANRFGHVRVSSLISGHSVFTAGGNISLHSYGQAVDIAELGHVNIYGNQQADSVTVKAVKAILRMPESMQPKELISLWDLGGASFAASDHDDHIHIGYVTEHDADHEQHEGEASEADEFDEAVSQENSAGEAGESSDEDLFDTVF